LKDLIGGIMKKILAFAVGLSLLLVGFAPAQAATKYVANQKTLSSFSSSATGLTSEQRAEVKAAVEANPYAEKFVCTGIRYFSQPMSENIKVRARAKAACEYAKRLNPDLSTFFQNKPTQARSYAGKVLLTIKVPADKANAVPAGYVETDPIDWKINPNYQVGKKCGGGFGWQVVGLDSRKNPAFLRCSNPNGGVFRVDARMPKIDPKTKKPLVPVKVPSQSLFGYSPNVYIEPQVVSSRPKTQLTAGAFDEFAQCKIAEVEDGSPDKSFGFPLPENRLDLKEGFKILVIPVQFTDHRTTNKPADDLADVVSALTNFYVRASNVPISFEWTIPDSYYPMGKTIDSYDLGIEFDGSFQTDFWTNYRAYLQDVIDLVDDEYDFSEFDAVIVEEPRSVTDAEHGMFIPHAPNSSNPSEGLFSEEGQIQGLLVTGNDELRDVPNWIHEFGHLLGLPDRNWQSGAKPGFDIMWGWYGSPELSVWSRWLLEILKDEQVDCKTDTATSKHLVQPVAWVGDYKKAVVIPVSDHEVIVVESRRRQGYDALFGKESEGAYVYRVDTSAKMYQPDTKKIVDVVAPARSRPIADWALDASLKLGESVTSDGWTIKVVETGAFGDVIEVSKGG
jgi:M6 family metalloprotease-like protein